MSLKLPPVQKPAMRSESLQRSGGGGSGTGPRSCLWLSTTLEGTAGRRIQDECQEQWSNTLAGTRAQISALLWWQWPILCVTQHWRTNMASCAGVLTYIGLRLSTLCRKRRLYSDTWLRKSKVQTLWVILRFRRQFDQAARVTREVSDVSEDTIVLLDTL